MRPDELMFSIAHHIQQYEDQHAAEPAGLQLNEQDLLELASHLGLEWDLQYRPPPLILGYQTRVVSDLKPGWFRVMSASTRPGSTRLVDFEGTDNSNRKVK